MQYGIGGVSTTNRDTYKLHIAYRKMCRYIFMTLLCARILDLLNVFNITPILELIALEIRTFMRPGLEIKYFELQLLLIYAMNGL